MVVDIIVQSEINRKENKLYPFRQRPYRPNFSGCLLVIKILLLIVLFGNLKPLTGKFYSRWDFVDPDDLDDPSIEELILKHERSSPKEKYKECVTTNMEYGWYVEPPIIRRRFNFFFPKRSSWVTQVGALIAKEDEKNPKRPFTGVAFKV